MSVLAPRLMFYTFIMVKLPTTIGFPILHIKQIITLAIAVTLACPVYAQTRTKPAMAVPVKEAKAKKASAHPPTKKAPTDQTIVPFTLDLVAGDHMVPNYRGHSIDRIIAAIEKNLESVGRKGEFESTVDYEKRLATNVARPFLGGSTVADTFAFVLSFDSGGQYKEVEELKYSYGTRYFYDPDTSRLHLLVRPKHHELDGNGGSVTKPEWFYNPSGTGGYSQSRYGCGFDMQSTRKERGIFTHVTIKGISIAPTSLALGHKAIAYDGSCQGIIIKDLMDRARAQRLLPSLKALIVQRLIRPYVVYDYGGIDLYTFSRKYLYGDVLGIVLFSGETGEIIGRFPKDFGKALNNHNSLAGNSKATESELSEAAKIINSSLPVRFGLEIQWDSVVAIKDTLQLNLTMFNLNSSSLTGHGPDNTILAQAQRDLTEAVCNHEEPNLFKLFLNHGVAVSFALHTNDAKHFFTFTIPADQCRSKGE